MDETPTDQGPGPASTTGAGGTLAGASLTPLALRYLEQTRPWVLFMAVVTFGSAALMGLVALAMPFLGIFSGLSSGESGGLGALGGAIGGGLLALLYLAIACVYIAPALYLSRYAGAIQRLKANATAAGLEDALKHQKSFWRFVGILTAIGLVVAVVGLGLAVVAGVIGAMLAARP